MARCKSCSAPLLSHSIKCGYCGVRNDIDLKGIHEYTTARPESERSCPRCDKVLETIDLNIEGHFYIERCNACMGMFFDPGELQFLLDKTVTNVYSIDYQRLVNINKELHRRESVVQYIKCPVCRELMNRINFGARSGVIVDRCKAHGIWLDGGELKHLMQWRKAGGKLLQEKRAVQRQQAEQKQKERRESDRRKYIAKAHQQDRSGGLYFASHRNESNLIDLVSDVVFKLFR